MNNKIELYINTIKYLKPSQMYHRVINRFNRKFNKWKQPIFNTPVEIKLQTDINSDINFFLIPEIEFDKEYLARFDIDEILNNQFKFINIKNKVDLSKAWNSVDLQQLWRYNLHYFEYVFKLAYEYKKGNNPQLYYNEFKRLIENWIDNNPIGYGDGWHPYTISLRISNWISVYPIFQDELKKDLDFDKKIKESIQLQYVYLKSNLEKDVLGNHYFENIKALIIGSIFFNDSEIQEKFKKELLLQLDEQILEDGMHFELSPMYHKIILEDLIKITHWLKNDSIYERLIIYIQKMIDVMYSLEDNFGKTPAFNDSADGISKDYKSLLTACAKHFNLKPRFKSNLENSGFYILKNNNSKLIFDTGDICPSYLPAHGHCDALSYELSVNNRPLIVNLGTYKYESGEWRDYFRSTKAHNTVMISNKEQSQFWGSFRVAKRIKEVGRKQFLYKDIKFYAGKYTSYHGYTHKRFIGKLSDNIFIILDSVEMVSDTCVKSYLHFLPGAIIENINKTESNRNIVSITFDQEIVKIATIGVNEIDIEQSWYSGQFNVKEENKAIVFSKSKDSKKFFGYIIALSDSNYEAIEAENELKIKCDKEVIINYDELGAML
ncbi:alginate lyase family protein [Ruminiclostridium herbifermentans]|uniref:Alginate lyase family protein n=1 Tax=Ruminiclostridium herbifermentans TaxID=2488810 RepID=A0A4V6EQ85_9FIRM|nr:heparinase II/III family protein [Ruminiclostridium herbifermentans]QNU66806.1 alginate lyase family protein [Ruminiclostridium herbifermentans]